MIRICLLIALVVGVFAVPTCALAQPYLPADHDRSAAFETASSTLDGRYFILIFTAQSQPKIPRATHTWAVMVQADASGTVVADTISWLPTDLRIKPYHFAVEPGMNRSYEATISHILAESEQRITLWGPYEASGECYERFLAQKERLESGAVGYQCLDFIGANALHHRGCNCVHALTPVHGTSLGDVTQQYGDDSGEFISEVLLRRGYAAPYRREHDWLLTTLELDSVPMLRRIVTPPVMAGATPLGSFR
jgi:hypothetical protein